MVVSGVNYADDDDDDPEDNDDADKDSIDIPNTYDYQLHPNSYLPTYHLGSDPETDEATPMLAGDIAGVGSGVGGVGVNHRYASGNRPIHPKYGVPSTAAANHLLPMARTLATKTEPLPASSITAQTVADKCVEDEVCELEVEESVDGMNREVAVTPPAFKLAS